MGGASQPHCCVQEEDPQTEGVEPRIQDMTGHSASEEQGCPLAGFGVPDFLSCRQREPPQYGQETSQSSVAYMSPRPAETTAGWHEVPVPRSNLVASVPVGSMWNAASGQRVLQGPDMNLTIGMV